MQPFLRSGCLNKRTSVVKQYLGREYVITGTIYGINGYCDYVSERRGFLERAFRRLFNPDQQNFTTALAAYSIHHFATVVEHEPDAYQPLGYSNRAVQGASLYGGLRCKSKNFVDHDARCIVDFLTLLLGAKDWRRSRYARHLAKIPLPNVTPTASAAASVQSIKRPGTKC